MAIRMRVHKAGLGKLPEVQQLLYNSASVPSIVIGTVVIQTAGYAVVAGADPTEIVGVAAEAVTTHPGFDAANSPATITGRKFTVGVIRPNQVTTFMATLTNGSSATATPVVADLGAQYGITAYSGVWTVDKNKTGGDARVEVVGYDTEVYGDVVFFKWLDSALSVD